MLGIIARTGFFSGAATQGGVEFVHKQVDGFVSIPVVHGRNDIRALYFDAALGDKAGHALRLVVIKIDANPVDARFVAEESRDFFGDALLQRRGEVEMDAVGYEFRGEIFGSKEVG